MLEAVCASASPKLEYSESRCHCHAQQALEIGQAANHPSVCVAAILRHHVVAHLMLCGAIVKGRPLTALHVDDAMRMHACWKATSTFAPACMTLEKQDAGQTNGVTTTAGLNG